MFSLRTTILSWQIVKNPVKRCCSTNNFRKFKHSFTDLRCLDKKEVQQFFKSLQAIITDADGVLWLNDDPIEGSVDTFNWFQNQHKNCYIVTNNSTRTRQNLQEKACSMGLEVDERQIINTTYCTAKYLEKLNFNKKAYVIGREGMAWELQNLGIKLLPIEEEVMKGSTADLRQNLKLDREVKAVIVGFDEFFGFPKLTKACCYLKDPECLFIAASTDNQGPTPTIMLPGTGCLVKAIETCSNRLATIIGKPNAEFIKPLITKGCLKPATTLMVGDRGSTDMLFGYNCGFFTLFVTSGVDTLQDVRQWQTSENCELHKQIPDFYLPKLGDLKYILTE
ncbi:glycerol-3-phosphate phosphatase-like [Lucilia cuprina]|uniref:glycerol-3-phosphate phosphatase-like n=1 Tax=Lucilia cuprina TaxID=7375 RepID=UPI001F05119E|nr:glycerol-3-phosphate phosphatase-like [Lucilia cuprina]